MLKVQSVSKTFHPGTVNANTALDGLSLHLKNGEFVTVIGGNGAGKSTLLNAIAGTFPVDGGSIVLDGTDLTRLPEYKRAAFLGRVFQDPMMGTAPTMQIDENMALASRRGQKRGLGWGMKKEEQQRYRELLAALNLGLEDRMSTKVGLLSGGQRQSLTLLMAVLKNPKLLLLDEHTAALDPRTAQKVLEITEQLVSTRRLTTLMITHNMRDALHLGDRLIMMDGGRIVLDIAGEEKKNLTVSDLLVRFSAAAGKDEVSDKLLLSK
jgi:putative ABC transport system ATP-binding protein